MQSGTQNVGESSSVPFSSQNSSSHRHYARLWAQCMSTYGLQQGYKIVKGLVYWATRPPHLLSSWSTPWIVHHPLSNSQWGFQKRKSTTTALLSTTHQWLIALEQGKEFCAFFLDLRKAFDSVPHKQLANKLQPLNLDCHVQH